MFTRLYQISCASFYQHILDDIDIYIFTCCCIWTATICNFKWAWYIKMGPAPLIPLRQANVTNRASHVFLPKLSSIGGKMIRTTSRKDSRLQFCPIWPSLWWMVFMMYKELKINMKNSFTSEHRALFQFFSSSHMNLNWSLSSLCAPIIHPCFLMISKSRAQ